jgi:hypothetical protein
VVAPTRQKVQKQLVDIRLVAATLDPKTGSLARRRRRFARLQEKYSRSKEPSQKQLSKQMASWVVGLFVLVVGKVPCDNLDLGVATFRRPEKLGKQRSYDERGRPL